MEEVFIDFDEQDNPVVSVQGVKGNACKNLTSDLEHKLGKVTKVEKTKEYYEVDRGSNDRARNRS